MNARQARRIVQWMNGQYLVAADHFGLGDEEMAPLSDDDMRRLNEAQRDLGEELLRRSGMDRHIETADIVSAVLGTLDEGTEDRP